MLSATLLDRYRRAGARLPFAEPGGFFGAPFEGSYWRLTDRDRGLVVVALCGIVRDPPARGTLIALAVHPHGVVESSLTDAGAGEAGRFEVNAGERLRATPTSLVVTPSATARLNLELDSSRRFPRRPFGALGIAHLIPGLPHYWQPVVLGAAARGELDLGGERIVLEGTVYTERTWGRVFPERWWWGQASAFDDDVALSFAGGPIRLGGLTVAPTAAVLRLGAKTVALAPPRARARAAVGGGAWRVDLTSAVHRLRVEGSDPDRSTVALPVPRFDRQGVEARASQALSGVIEVELRRGRRTVFRGESRLAGLEQERRAFD